MNFKLRSDINARTALVYGGAAFLLVIVGFRSIFATLDPEHVGLMTYLSIAALVLEFVLLLVYAQSIYNLGPDGDGGGSQVSASAAAGEISKMDKDSVSALTGAVAGLKEELRDHNKKIETLSDGVNKLVKGSVKKEIHKEISNILNKALDK